MGTGSLILGHYVGALCCIFVSALFFFGMVFLGRRKRDRTHARSLEIREVPESAEEIDPSRDVDPTDDTR